ncbi:hypothetical protein L5515_013477 [Caenorhabditis briggsae]|uniref:Uncharacterized protein n=1 Tax=Caenorhabditis briggsae TaxID=6238 RepID=A0AAE9E6H2_CAEBR|nr:hypothetical protein L5515_013477 [Caenorhabditis briggsae]
MISGKESNDIPTTRKETADVEMDSPASKTSGSARKEGWFSTKNLIILGIAAISSLAVVGLILYFTLPTSSESAPKFAALVGGNISTTPGPSTEDPNEPPKLIFAQALFRHGARAPDKGYPPEVAKYFPRGRGQLTDRGFNTSYQMGLFLRKRYVETRFLSSEMISREMKWFSRRMDRVLSTASTVGAAMFRNPKQKYTSVAIQTEDDRDNFLLNFPIPCKVKTDYRNKTCPDLLRKDNKEDKYTTALKCLGPWPSIFNKFNVTDSDMYINMVRNGVPVSQEVRDNYAEISKEFMKARNYLNGLYSREYIQVKFGVLVDKMLRDMETAWKLYQRKIHKRKFRVYSTQDWVMSGILSAFGVHEHILAHGPQEEPNYNTLILVELWKKNGIPYVKFLYKPEEETQLDHNLMDLTGVIPGCDGKKKCSLKRFNNCCDNTRASKRTQKKLCAFPKPVTTNSSTMITHNSR